MKNIMCSSRLYWANRHYRQT